MMPGLSLSELVARGVPARIAGDASTVVSGVTRDSRTVKPGDLFAALPGAKADGLTFVAEAKERGAVAVLAARAFDGGLPTLLADDPGLALSIAAERLYGDPTASLAVVGITGTNGKTTSTRLVESILKGTGARPAILGTGYFRAPGIDEATAFTTPFGDDLSRCARRAVEAGATHLVMEVSSHGLDQHRVDAVRFAVAGFTNLTQDHLDYHGTMEAYGAAKARLFTELAPATSVLNVDDAFGQALASRARGRVIRCSKRPDADAEIRVLAWTMDREGIRATVETPAGRAELESPLVGTHNLENLLVALGVAVGLGLPLDGVVHALRTARGAEGRLERVEDPRGVAVLVDYAHTPDALARVLAALRPLTKGRLFVVFGCGGDRDRTKRPKMGRAAAEAADVLVITSDNPRTEVPSAILAEIEPGVREGSCPMVAEGELGEAKRGYVVVEDRARAIELALLAAREGDTVLLAGKGHEDYQIVGTVKRPFDDRVEARKVIERLGGKS
ncbi:MAG: UDP-N-acetylmuramoyl-L-alanyl-D-glutamate--2,6-diaminopimelate ligase [Polyangiales bacterium]